MSFCKGRNQSVWMDSKEERRGGTLVNFILIERDVLGLNASTIRWKISGVRFFHIISGREILPMSGPDGGFD